MQSLQVDLADSQAVATAFATVAERGSIDATEYSMPAIDLNLGFYQVAKHYYFPGWHQQSTLFDLMISKKKWDGLSDVQKAQLEVEEAYLDQARWTRMSILNAARMGRFSSDFTISEYAREIWAVPTRR